MATVWGLAKSMEKEGIKYYEKCAADPRNRDVAPVFTLLVKEEARHLAVFEKMEKGFSAPANALTPSMARAKKIFAKLAARSRQSEIKPGVESAYKAALKMEQESIKHYSGMMKKLDDLQKSALEHIIEEERNHVRLMESFIEYVRRPEEWLENAEFNQLEEY